MSQMEELKKILLVEDDPVLGNSLKVAMELEGFSVVWARDLAQAREQKREGVFNLLVLDRGLPDGDGLSLCQESRGNGETTPIIILTAQTDEDSVVQGLNSGATDYVRKPFSTKEFIARIRAATREISLKDKQIRWHDVTISLEKRQVLIGDKLIDFNRREYDLFLHFMKRPETVLTRAALLEGLDKDGEIFDRTIDSHISHIRNRLKSAGVMTVHISSVYGVGYRLEKK